MGIIIKDMNMPESCISCEFHSWSFKRDGIYCRRTDRNLGAIDYYHTRDSECPLEEYEDALD